MTYQIIKEHTSSGTVVVRTSCYGSTLKFLMELFDEAQRDFPDLEHEQVEVKHYAGSCYSRTYGLEFSAPSDIPDTYKEIKALEYTH